MERVQQLALVRTFLVTGVIACVAATAWKMLAFHGPLNALENPQWEEQLSRQHLYTHPIVLFGDSQVYNWPIATSFGVLPVLDRGLNGDFAVEATRRFERDVLPLKPALVVILIGTNDLAHGASPESILQSIDQMAAAADKQKAAVVLCSVLPARGEAARIRPREEIKWLNARLRDLARAQGATYVDLYSTLLNERGELAENFTEDGLHPNAAGYVRMTRALLPRLLQSLVGGELRATH